MKGGGGGGRTREKKTIGPIRSRIKAGHIFVANQNTNKGLTHSCAGVRKLISQSEILSGATWGNPRALSRRFPRTRPFDTNKTSPNPHIQWMLEIFGGYFSNSSNLSGYFP